MKTFRVTTSTGLSLEAQGDFVKRYCGDLAVLASTPDGETREVAYFRDYVCYREVQSDAEGTDL